MEAEKLYQYSLLVFGAALALAALWAYRLNEDNIGKWEKLPRDLFWGTALAGLDLIWCVPHARPLLPATLQGYLIPTAIGCAVAAYWLLDYLFARALGGFFILLAYYLLHESFTYHTPVLPLFSIFCYVMGFTGLFLCGKPYLLRDWIKALPRERGWRLITAGVTGAFSILCLVLGSYHYFIVK